MILAFLGPADAVLFTSISTVSGLLAIPLNFMRLRLLKEHSRLDIVVSAASVVAAVVVLARARARSACSGSSSAPAWTESATLAAAPARLRVACRVARDHDPVRRPPPRGRGAPRSPACAPRSSVLTFALAAIGLALRQPAGGVPRPPRRRARLGRRLRGRPPASSRAGHAPRPRAGREAGGVTREAGARRPAVLHRHEGRHGVLRARGVLAPLARRPRARVRRLASSELAATDASWFPGRVVDSGISGEDRVAWARGELFSVARARPAARCRRGALSRELRARGARACPWCSPCTTCSRSGTPSTCPGAYARILRAMIRVGRPLGASASSRSAAPRATTSSRYLGVPAERVAGDPAGRHRRPSGATPTPSRAIDAELAARRRQPDAAQGLRDPARGARPDRRRPSARASSITGSHGDDPLAPLVERLGLRRPRRPARLAEPRRAGSPVRRVDRARLPDALRGLRPPAARGDGPRMPRDRVRPAGLHEVAGDAARLRRPGRPRGDRRRDPLAARRRRPSASGCRRPASPARPSSRGRPQPRPRGAARRGAAPARARRPSARHAARSSELRHRSTSVVDRAPRGRARRRSRSNHASVDRRSASPPTHRRARSRAEHVGRRRIRRDERRSRRRPTSSAAALSSPATTTLGRAVRRRLRDDQPEALARRRVHEHAATRDTAGELVVVDPADERDRVGDARAAPPPRGRARSRGRSRR